MIQNMFYDIPGPRDLEDGYLNDVYVRYAVNRFMNRNYGELGGPYYIPNTVMSQEELWTQMNYTVDYILKGQ